MRRDEKGITLVALIITIIILVILAAVSVAAVYNMGIVNYAVNGTQEYAQAAVAENQMLDSTTSVLDSTVTKLQEILNNVEPGDNSAIIQAFINEHFSEKENGEWTVNGKTMYDLGPGSSEDENYYLYNGVVYKSNNTESGYVVTKTDIDASTLGYNDTTKTFTTINYTYEKGSYTVTNEKYHIAISPYFYYYNSDGVFLYSTPGYF